MYNSTIIVKRKMLRCGHFSYNFSKGRCKDCATREQALIRINEANERGDEKEIKPKQYNAELERWFKERRKEMTGFCKHCKGKTTKADDKFYKASIAHILPKRLFKSVATHPLNWVELCFWGNSCHTNFDNNMLDIIELNCFNEVIEKFIAMYPSIDAKEKRYIPKTLLQYIEIDV